MCQKPEKNNKAFTIIELLTVMSIIVILIGLLVPALNSVRRYAMGVQQKKAFNAMEAGLELFRNDFDEDYPDSSAEDSDGTPYCGAMKFAEAMLGQDLLGFHPDSRFKADSIVSGGEGQLYRWSTEIQARDSMKERKEPYISVDQTSAHILTDIYDASGDGIGTGEFGSAGTDVMYVICDVFRRVLNKGESREAKVGMPVLYYKANVSGFANDLDTQDAEKPVRDSSNDFIYNYYDNEDILDLGVPDTTATLHELGDETNMNPFYSYIEDKKVDISISGISRPYNPKSFILISAGFDGIYGTKDDITNFDM